MTARAMSVLLKEMIDVHRQLLDIALKKTEAIKEGDAQAVGRLVLLEEPLIGQLSDLNEKREATAVSDVGRSGSGELPAFSEWLSAAVSEPHRDDLEELHRQLTDGLISLNRANKLNQELLRQSLQWVELSLNMLRPNGQAVTYGHQGTGSQSSPYSGRIDSRA